MLIEFGILTGYVIAWAVRKAKRAGERLDQKTDDILDASMDRLHALVARKLGTDPALAELDSEITANGQASDLTRQRLELSLQAANPRPVVRRRDRSVAGGAEGGGANCRRHRDWARLHRRHGERLHPGNIRFRGRVADRTRSGRRPASRPSGAGPTERLTGPGADPTSRQIHAYGGIAANFIGSVVVNPSPDPPRSYYLRQVERIAPPELIGREAELAELATFVTADDAAPYLWLRAPAWTGKTALLSWFVLHPPPGVDVIAFFVTARLAAQDDRIAFTETVLEQLAAFLGRVLPPFLPETTREAHLLGLLAEAATASAERNRRLVLLVDGLDEDRGVTTGPEAHSIAALLPAEPFSTMRIVVSGRPNPPIPTDVPPWHPLRDKQVHRELTPSTVAEVVRAEAENDLWRLLRGTECERDILGLVTAARGGLTIADLAELTAVAPFEIRRMMLTVSGRSFAPRAGLWRTDAEAYLLAHDRLHAVATDVLGSRLLDEYRDRLNAWADTYRDRGWPAGTPEYLLLGYHQMLAETGDTSRLVGCALDVERHSRMLALAGDDEAALAEIAVAQRALLGAEPPDLTAAIRLARYRGRIHDRNASTHPPLPLAWAALDDRVRAYRLTRSLVDPEDRAEALVGMAEHAAGSGDVGRTVLLASQAETVAHDVPYQFRREEALASVAGVLVKAGLPELAEQVTEAIHGFESLAPALAACVRGLCVAGRRDRVGHLVDRAESAVRSARSAGFAVGEETAILAGMAARAGQFDRAEAFARSVEDPYEKMQAWLQLMEAAAEEDRARYAAEAISLAKTADDDPRTVLYKHLYPSVLVTLAEAGYLDDAEALTHRVSTPFRRVLALAEVAKAMAGAGHHQRARRLTDAALSLLIVDSLVDTDSRSFYVEPWIRAPIAVITALGSVGRNQQAIEIAMATHTRITRAYYDRASDRWQHLADLAGAAATVREFAVAEIFARSITRPYSRSVVLSGLAGAMAKNGQRADARRLLTEAEALARAVVAPFDLARTLIMVAGALSRHGQHHRATQLLDRARSLARLAVDDEERQKLRELLARPEDAVRAQVNVDTMGDIGDVRSVAMLAGQGHFEKALAKANEIVHPYWRGRTLTELAELLDEQGQRNRAVHVAAMACGAGPWTTPLELIGALQPSALVTVADDILSEPAPAATEVDVGQWMFRHRPRLSWW